MKKAGRPPIPKAELRSKRFPVRYRKAEFDLVKRAAKVKNEDTTVYVRKASIAAARRDLKTVAKKTA